MNTIWGDMRGNHVIGNSGGARDARMRACDDIGREDREAGIRAAIMPVSS
ncbi:MAG: hypothetical protein AAB229_01075 [Candidatus Hydrogenedentota bacterium]